MNWRGSILETAATFAGISIAFIAAVRTVPADIASELQAPPVVYGMMGLTAVLSTVICSASLLSLWDRARGDRALRVAISLLAVCTLVLGIAVVVFQWPETGEAIAEGLGRLGDWFHEFAKCFIRQE